MNDATPVSSSKSKIDYLEIEESAQFLELQSRHRRFVFPLTAFFLVWYFGFVLMAAYAPSVMAIPVFGLINLGLVLGLAQVATTFIITMWYVSFANRRLDPLSLAMRTKLEAMERAGTTASEQSEIDRRAGLAKS
ncbi:DUF485 domain-containing protein [Cryobacterium melibiosiphilum]|uniref:DUF485 domain-containing protein n=1 Tax=Cryobacterium melibiosiphilum TaxID=995039 RepID=A0A3A5MBI6_9MICO|nr:DUF485 domain-containing protein [Cryobacterium melibiosiphilum]RJT87480.1 DUF485 domain-containing protein [Cryobacterium melibiosiphilum]